MSTTVSALVASTVAQRCRVDRAGRLDDKATPCRQGLEVIDGVVGQTALQHVADKLWIKDAVLCRNTAACSAVVDLPAPTCA